MAELPKPDFFRRIDDSDDESFYRYPRLLVHIDDGAIAKVGEIYADLLPAGGVILDLMSSWRSHLPDRIGPAKVVGLGLNRVEMDDNPALGEVVVHNVNLNPRMPFADESFDGAVMTVSVQYLTRPVELFADAGRVLKPHAPFVVTFSNRMFPTKAVALWHSSNNEQRVSVVTRYFAESGAFEKIEVLDRSTATDPPSDPIWAIAGFKIASGSAE
jgi:SAM-dependent methyltransferase